MASQDRRIQENRYRPGDWADESRRYQSGRRDFQGGPGDYGRGRELTFREDYARYGDYLGRHPGDLSGRNHFDEEYFVDESQLTSRDYFDRDVLDRDRLERERIARNFVPREFEGYSTRAFGPAPAQVHRSGSRGDVAGSASHYGRGPKNYRRSDERIREDIGDRLTDDHYVDASNLEVHVLNGEVTLDGTVENRLQRHRSELIAELVSGVNHVQNNLRVRETTPNAQPSEASAQSSHALNK
jgi:hypothetical protein